MFIMAHPTYLVLKVARKAYALSGWQALVMQSFTIVGYLLLSIGVAWATSCMVDRYLSKGSQVMRRERLGSAITFSFK
eukprot:CAMPEP_0169175188 /NCGR_PEP_ID=MMETSP1015-20121227/65045_1 /TAXON_ID=342587 /ORGANISM="Karlodinium micrum, Strain CCMP2283" /LENGTH=77 /DNA_ID=CAMNT_0009249295 /DNA_START=470 /DNA_END=703 /DNA_ORIENTATION=-